MGQFWLRCRPGAWRGVDLSCKISSFPFLQRRFWVACFHLFFPESRCLGAGFLCSDSVLSYPLNYYVRFSLCLEFHTFTNLARSYYGRWLWMLIFTFRMDQIWKRADYLQDCNTTCIFYAVVNCGTWLEERYMKLCSCICWFDLL